MALDTLSVYSKQVDDIFIFDRIIAELRYAEALLTDGYVEKWQAMQGLPCRRASWLFRARKKRVMSNAS